MTDPRVDEYLARLPADQQRALGRLRAEVARVAPEAEETISYGMPAFRLDGRFFLSYAGWKRHCSVYPFHDELLDRYADALRGYGRTKGSLHFSEAQPLPDGLIAELARIQIARVRGVRSGKY